MPKFIVPNGSGITAQATAGGLRILLGAAAATALAACSASATFSTANANSRSAGDAVAVQVVLASHGRVVPFRFSDPGFRLWRCGAETPQYDEIEM
jgi:hypothetical protein